MDSRRLTGLMACCVPLLGSCAVQQTAQAPNWMVAPVNRVSNAAGPAAYYQLGRYYQGQHRYIQAAAAYRKALALDPDSVDALNGLGVVYALQGHYDQAAELLSRAVTAAPGSAQAQNNLGYVRYLQGDFRKAIVSLREATRLDPSNQHALANLALAYARSGDEADALIARTEVTGMPAAGHVRSGSVIRTQPGTVAVAQQPVAAIPPGVGAVQVAGVEIPRMPSQIVAVRIAQNVIELRDRNVGGASAVGDASAVRDASVVQDARPAAMRLMNVEIANGNGVPGMARQVGQYLHTRGFVAGRLTNQKPFVVRVTLIQYSSGYRYAAERLRALLPSSAHMVMNSAAHDRIPLRLVLGHNMAGDTRWLETHEMPARLAMNQTTVGAVLRETSVDGETR